MNRRWFTTARLARSTVLPRPYPVLRGPEQSKERMGQNEPCNDHGQVERVIDRDQPVDVQRIIDVQIVMGHQDTASHASETYMTRAVRVASPVAAFTRGQP